MRMEIVRTETVSIEHGFGLRKVERSVGKCVCGREVWLIDPLDNDCECGRIYNMSGQEVQCHARDIDPADAGEVYDEEGW